MTAPRKQKPMKANLWAMVDKHTGEIYDISNERDSFRNYRIIDENNKSCAKVVAGVFTPLPNRAKRK